MRAIDKDALMSALKHRLTIGIWVDGKVEMCKSIPTEAIFEFIKHFPAIDPVKHAKWIPHKPGDVYACSNCGYGMLATMRFRDGRCIGARYDNKTPYCPYCGARMDGE